MLFVGISKKAALGVAFFFGCIVMGQAEGGPAHDLFAAAAKGDVVAVVRSIKSGVEIDARDEAGRTPLLIATHNNRVGAARVLIDAGADVNAKDSIADTPFLYAGAEGRIDILNMTLGAGANLKDTNRYGGTALIPAAHHGHPEAVRILLEAGVAPDHINRLGWTALLEAIILGDGGSTHTGIVKLLVEGGADVNIPDKDGVTPLTHAKRRGYTAIAEILEAAHAR
jgi:ankyrin repeat protein